MILKMSTEEFSELSVSGKKKVFKDFVKAKKVDEIIYGSMTNGMWGEYRIRHDYYAYSLIKVQPADGGQTELLIFNFRTKEWQDEAI